MAVDIGRGRTNAGQIKWKGLDKVLRNLNAMTGKIHGKTRKGMTIVTLKIRRDAQILTPVDTGNLRASAYTIVGGGKKRVTPAMPKVNGAGSGIATKEVGLSTAQLCKTSNGFLIDLFLENHSKFFGDSIPIASAAR